MFSYAWLETLKAGDLVVESSGWSNRRISAVSKVTATQIVVGANRYKKRNGSLVGGGTWSTASIHPATPEMIAEIQDEAARRPLISRLRDQSWKDLPTEKLERIAAILDEPDAP